MEKMKDNNDNNYDAYSDHDNKNNNNKNNGSDSNSNDNDNNNNCICLKISQHNRIIKHAQPHHDTEKTNCQFSDCSAICMTLPASCLCPVQ